MGPIMLSYRMVPPLVRGADGTSTAVHGKRLPDAVRELDRGLSALRDVQSRGHGLRSVGWAVSDGPDCRAWAAMGRNTMATRNECCFETLRLILHSEY